METERFSWDERKRVSNLRKHGIDFAIVERFEFDTAIITIDARRDYGEVRYRAFGVIDDRLHVLVHRTWRKNPGHLVTAQMTEKEKPMPRPKKIRSTADDENPEWTKEDFARARPAAELVPEIVTAYRRFRGPQKRPTKRLVSLRLDPDVIEHFRARGPGWQVRINAALRKAAGI